MSKFRNITAEHREVGVGCPVRLVGPDEVIHVVDDVDDSYACQPDLWQPVADVTRTAPAVAKKAADDASAGNAG